MVVRYTELTGVGDLLSNDRFKFYFGTIPGAGSGDTLSVLCDHVTVPTRTHGHVQRKVLGFPVGFTGGISTENTLSASFYDNQRGTAYRLLSDWLNFCVDPATGARPLKSEYAVQCKLDIYDTTGAAPISFKLHGVFPYSLQFTELQEASGPAKYEAEFNVDWVEPVYSGGSNSAGASQSGKSSNLGPGDNSFNIGATRGGNSAVNLVSNAMALSQFAQRFLG